MNDKHDEKIKSLEEEIISLQDQLVNPVTFGDY